MNVAMEVRYMRYTAQKKYDGHDRKTVNEYMKSLNWKKVILFYM